MTDLSPAAKAVVDAFNSAARPEPHHQREAIAAALRAAADQSCFADIEVGLTSEVILSEVILVDHILAIADELEAQ